MHNLPTNNETNIIRNIFNISTQLNEAKSLKEATDGTYAERVVKLSNETGGYVDPRAVQFSPEEQEDWSRKARLTGTNIATIKADEINKGFDEERKAKRAKEAEESKARVKAWQSSPEYQNQVQADRARAAAVSADRAKQEAARAKQAAEGPGSGVEKQPLGKLGAGRESETGAYDRAKDQSVLQTVLGGIGMSREDIKARELEAAGAPVAAKQKEVWNAPETIEKAASGDPRMLSQLVSRGKMSQEEAEKQLEQHVKLRGGHDDVTKHIEKRLKELRATPPAPVRIPATSDDAPIIAKAAAKAVYDTSELGRGLNAIKSAWDWFTGNKTMQESYYNRLANLFEETRVNDEPMSGVNPAAYGYTPKGQRKARLAAQGFAEPMKSWAGDSTTEAPDLEPERTERPHIDTVVAPHIETLIRAATENDIDLSHGEAFDPRSKDHQRLIIKTKDPAVMKASEAIRQIRNDYGMED